MHITSTCTMQVCYRLAIFEQGAAISHQDTESQSTNEKVIVAIFKQKPLRLGAQQQPVMQSHYSAEPS